MAVHVSVMYRQLPLTQGSQRAYPARLLPLFGVQLSCREDT
jgi:hypothetical protein